MGVVVSKKDGQEKTKKVQKTAAVVNAFKPTPSPVNSRKAKDFDNNDTNYQPKYDSSLGNFSLTGRNYDKGSLSYGLPELEDLDSGSRSAGTTGYWNGAEDTTKSIPYFGAWGNRVCSVYP